MAEAAMFSLASKLLSMIASPAIEMAYEKGRSIWEAEDELDKLMRTLQSIQAVLLDAEKKQQRSDVVRDWIKRVKDVLYDAEDFLDEVAIDGMLRQQIKGNKLVKKVRVSCSKLNPIISRNSIATKVKAIRKSLLEIFADMAQFEFVKCQHEEPISSVRNGQDPGSFVDSKEVFGREKDKKAVIEMLLQKQSNLVEPDVSVIAVVGIGGMGKTTLAQLVYNDEEVQMNFEKRWFACISDTSDDKEVLGKIFQSICKKGYGHMNVDQIQCEIRDSIKDIRKFLLVLDDVWDENHARWLHRMSLLRGSEKGSKIIVTTRSLSVARVVGALEPYNLDGLSKDASWALFKRVAFTPEQENNPRWSKLGREIVKKCANVPLAIRSVGSLLYTKTTIQEWESFKHEELSKLEHSGDRSIMDTLRLSYEHLPTNLKHCFAYCSLFPKDFEFRKKSLIYLWIAQGYIKPNHEEQAVEVAGHSHFMDLFRRSFFQDVYMDLNGDIISCKMHDLIHDLAQNVAGEDIISLTMPSDQFNKSARHASVGCKMHSSWEILARLPDTDRLRSLIFVGGSRFVLPLDQEFTTFKYLRTLSLSSLGIEIVPSSIGELKHLRYLDLSNNPFQTLPNSLMNLLNLLTLDIQGCYGLTSLPDSFGKLISLRHLNITSCDLLKSMPPGMGEMSSLQYLSNFKVVGKIEGVKTSRLDALARLELKGTLSLNFGYDCDGDECWQLPVSVEQLFISRYPGTRIPQWAHGTSLLPNLAYLHMKDCSKVKYLPSIRCLPNLKSLNLEGLKELEYIEEEEEEEEESFFPLLEELHLDGLPKLKGWRKREIASTETNLCFPLLAQLMIKRCRKLDYFPQCLRILNLDIQELDSVVVIQQLLSASSLEAISISDCKEILSFPDEAFTSLRSCSIYECDSLKAFHLRAASPHLEQIAIGICNGLVSVELEALPSLISLEITSCQRVKSMRIANLNVLQELKIWGFPKELELWGEQKDEMRVDWDSLPNLSLLKVDRLPSPEELPDCLRHRQTLGKLQIFDNVFTWMRIQILQRSE